MSSSMKMVGFLVFFHLCLIIFQHKIEIELQDRNENQSQKNNTFFPTTTGSGTYSQVNLTSQTTNFSFGFSQQEERRNGEGTLWNGEGPLWNGLPEGNYNTNNQDHEYRRQRDAITDYRQNGIDFENQDEEVEIDNDSFAYPEESQYILDEYYEDDKDNESEDGELFENLPAATQALLDNPPQTTNIERTQKIMDDIFNEDDTKVVKDENEGLYLRHWVCDKVAKFYEEKNISKLFKWQKECLDQNFNSEENLVYTAPTSGGKTLVSELIIMNNLKEKSMINILYVVPYVALAEEKKKYFGRLVETIDHSATSIYPELKKGKKKKDRPRDVGGAVVVCTMERASGIVKVLMSEKRMHELSLVVIDEFHMLSDRTRGSTLELLVTKILHHNKYLGGGRKVRIIGMSATIPNLEDISDWMGGKSYVSDYRPVPLVEYIYNSEDRKLILPYNDENKCQKSCILKDYEKDYKEYGAVKYIRLVEETLEVGGSVLIFCFTRKYCRDNAFILKNSIEKHLLKPWSYMSSQPGRKRSNVVDSNLDYFEDEGDEDEDEGEGDDDDGFRANYEAKASRDQAVDELERLPFRSDLLELVKNGVAYHHAGLSSEEKEAVEMAYEKGGIRVIACTTTLAVGVNLPARRVIFHGIRGYRRKLMLKNNYKQAAGRAGRKGLDENGESIIVVRKGDVTPAIKLILNNEHEEELLKIQSQLRGSIAQALLEIIVIKSPSSYHFRRGGASKAAKEDMHDFLENTFYFYTLKKDRSKRIHEYRFGVGEAVSKYASGFRDAIQESLEWLDKQGMVEMQDRDSYFPSKAGRAVYSSGLKVDTGVTLMAELSETRKMGLVMDTKLQILYVVCCGNDKDSDTGGMAERQLNQARGELQKNQYELAMERIQFDSDEFVNADVENEPKFRRLFKALVLTELIEDTPPKDISDKFFLGHGDIQKYRKDVIRLGEVVKQFCKVMEWPGLVGSVKEVVYLLQFRVCESLVKICKSITNLKPQLAKKLRNEYNLRQVLDYAQIDEEELADFIEKVKAQNYNNAKRKRLDETKIFDLAKRIVGEAKSKFDELPKLSYTPSRSLRGSRSLSGTNRKRRGKWVFPEFLKYCDEEDLGKKNYPGPFPVPKIDDDDTLKEFVDSVLEMEPEIISLRIVLHEDPNLARGIVVFLPDLGKELGLFFLFLGSEKISNSGLNYFQNNITLNEDIQKVGYRIKESISKTKDMRGTVHDPFVMKWLLDSETDYSSEDFGVIFEDYAGKYMKDKKEVFPLDESSHEYELVNCIKIAYESYYLYKTFKVNFRNNKKLWDLYLKVETKVTRILGVMMSGGIYYNPCEVKKIKKAVRNRIEEVKKRISEITGHEFDEADVNSSMKVRKLVFQTLGLKCPEYARGGTKAGKEILKDTKKKNNKIRCSIVCDYIIEFRSLLAVKSRYNWAEDEGEKRILRKCGWVQVSSSTGRITGELQTTKKNFKLHKGEIEDELASPRGVYVPRSDDFAFVSFDYKALEFRIIAHFSKDSSLSNIFGNDELDVFSELARMTFGVMYDESSAEQRNQMKGLTYGILYGMGAQSIQKKLGFDTVKQAEQLKEGFKRAFPELNKYIDQLSEWCLKECHLETNLGRKRNFKLPTNARDERKKKRQFLNTKIQATASDIFKVAMVKVMDMLWEGARRGEWKKDDFFLVCVLHDELIFEVRKTRLDEIARYIKRTMERAHEEIPGLEDLYIPLREKRGLDWGSMKEVL